MNFTIRENEFLNIFYLSVKEFVDSTYEDILEEINSNDFYFYEYMDKNEVSVSIMLNKVLYQNLKSFFVLVDAEYAIPAFNALRSAIEILRLFRLYISNDEFRHDYVKNDNLEFSKVSDYAFTQKNIVKKLDNDEKELRSKDKIPFSYILHNHSFTKGSSISDLHSELSKWSHVLNVNMLKLNCIDNDKIYLGISDQFTNSAQEYIRKYTEGVLIVVFEHTVVFNSHFRDSEYMLNLYEEYIEKFY